MGKIATDLTIAAIAMSGQDLAGLIIVISLTVCVGALVASGFTANNDLLAATIILGIVGALALLGALAGGSQILDKNGGFFAALVDEKYIVDDTVEDEPLYSEEELGDSPIRELFFQTPYPNGTPKLSPALIFPTDSYIVAQVGNLRETMLEDEELYVYLNANSSLAYDGLPLPSVMFQPDATKGIVNFDGLNYRINGSNEKFKGICEYLSIVDRAIEKYDLRLLEKDMLQVELARANTTCPVK